MTPPGRQEDLGDIPVVILCGGLGSRMGSSVMSLPKALVPIGNNPILWHVMNLYSAHGFRRFVLCLGHFSAQIRDYVTHELPLGDWDVMLLDTGEGTSTAGRLSQCRPHIDTDSFCATYVDGLSDVHLGELFAFHREHGRLATLTSVRPYCQFGVLEMRADGSVDAFVEKPRLDVWANGGFFVFRREFLAQLDPARDLESHALPVFAARSELKAYRHEGFWQCMDTWKDVSSLNHLLKTEKPPWQTWQETTRAA